MISDFFLCGIQHNDGKCVRFQYGAHKLCVENNQDKFPSL